MSRGEIGWGWRLGSRSGEEMSWREIEGREVTVFEISEEIAAAPVARYGRGRRHRMRRRLRKKGMREKYRVRLRDGYLSGTKMPCAPEIF